MNKGLFEFSNFLTSESGAYAFWSLLCISTIWWRMINLMNSGETLWYQVSLTFKKIKLFPIKSF